MAQATLNDLISHAATMEKQIRHFREIPTDPDFLQNLERTYIRLLHRIDHIKRTAPQQPTNTHSPPTPTPSPKPVQYISRKHQQFLLEWMHRIKDDVGFLESEINYCIHHTALGRLPKRDLDRLLKNANAIAHGIIQTTKGYIYSDDDTQTPKPIMPSPTTAISPTHQPETPINTAQSTPRRRADQGLRQNSIITGTSTNYGSLWP